MTTDDTELHARVLRLEALTAARDLLDEYAEAADTRELGPVLELFAPDAVLHSPRGVYLGHDQIATSYTDGWALDPSRKRHFVTNARLRALPDGTVRVTAHFFYLGRGVGRSVVGWGDYDDVVDVSGARPLFRTKRINHAVATDIVAGWSLDQGA
jgi:3-phenylpropionate/cinnamic acid dioxygenase small subunit